MTLIHFSQDEELKDKLPPHNSWVDPENSEREKTYHRKRGCGSLSPTKYTHATKFFLKMCWYHTSRHPIQDTEEWNCTPCGVSRSLKPHTLQCHIHVLFWTKIRECPLPHPYRSVKKMMDIFEERQTSSYLQTNSLHTLTTWFLYVGEIFIQLNKDSSGMNSKIAYYFFLKLNHS